MIARVVAALHAWPAARRLLWHRWYEYLARRHPHPGWRYMNYGYLPDPDTPPLLLAADDEADRAWIALYHHVASAVDLGGRELLEVGSGRGGGAAFVLRYLRPASVTGVDLSANATALARRLQDVPGLRFETGDAEALPFPNGRFDVVLNVESSHCYGSFARFVAEVARVLRPGGHFLYADLRPRGEEAGWRGQLEGSGLFVERERDITRNVLAAIEADSARRLALIGQLFPRPLVPLLREFAAVPGSMLHGQLASGTFVYKSFVLRKR